MNDSHGTEEGWSEDTATVIRAGASGGKLAVARLICERGANAGEAFPLHGDSPLVLGTGDGAALRLHDPEVSRRHATIEVAGTQLRVRDLGSKNGTYVNGTLVADAMLFGGEELRMGSTSLRVVLECAGNRPVPMSDDTSFGPVLGGSPSMRRLYPLCRRLAESDVPLVIEGETGTGKEAMAEAIHAASPRAARPFVVFDCTAVPPSLIESALFGHERGAFTGASAPRAGVFEEAHTGTLLIDEIGDLDKALQAKLLRAIQKSEVRRIGGSGWLKVDVRVIAATRRDLSREVRAGRFRDDLFFRLAVARLLLPPLRERREDIEPLARHFWTQYGGPEDAFPADVLERFRAQAWPGNVRELANTVARLVALGELADTYSALPQWPAVAAGEAASEDVIDRVVALNLPLADARDRVLREFERRYVMHLLDMHGGSAARAAAASGIGERYLRMLRARARRV